MVTLLHFLFLHSFTCQRTCLACRIYPRLKEMKKEKKKKDFTIYIFAYLIKKKIKIAAEGEKVSSISTGMMNRK